MNFHQNSLKLLLLHFSVNSFETRYTYFLGQSPNFVLFRILKFGFSDLKSLLLLQFPMDLYTYLRQSFEICIFFLANFHPIFIQIATGPTIFNGFL